jgi:hypothetical protein
MRDYIKLVENAMGEDFSGAIHATTPHSAAENLMAQARAAAATGGELGFGDSEEKRAHAFIEQTIAALKELGFKDFNDRKKFQITRPTA